MHTTWTHSNKKILGVQDHKGLHILEDSSDSYLNNLSIIIFADKKA